MSLVWPLLVQPGDFLGHFPGKLTAHEVEVEDELEVNSVAFSVLAHLSFVGFQIFLPGKIVSTQYMYVPQSITKYEQ